MVRQKGSHQRWDVGSCSATVPVATEIAPGTVRNIERQLAPCLGEGWLTKGLGDWCLSGA